MCLLSGLRGPWLRSEDAEPEARGVGKSPAIANRTGTCLGMLPPRTHASSPEASSPVISGWSSFAQHLVLGGERGSSLAGVLHSRVNTLDFQSSRRLGWEKQKAGVEMERRWEREGEH